MKRKKRREFIWNTISYAFDATFLIITAVSNTTMTFLTYLVPAFDIDLFVLVVEQHLQARHMAILCCEVQRGVLILK